MKIKVKWLTGSFMDRMPMAENIGTPSLIKPFSIAGAQPTQQYLDRDPISISPNDLINDW